MKTSAHFFTIALTLFVVAGITAQTRPIKYWIYFTDKNRSERPDAVLPSALSKLQESLGITDRAIQRRAKVLPPDRLITKEDIPVAASYIQQLEGRGIHIENTSRWFNAVTAFLTVEQQQMIRMLPFVQKVEPVRIYRKKIVDEASNPSPMPLQRSPIQLHNYGSSQAQVDLINVPAVHNLRIAGRGVLVGMLDTGFRWRSHEALQNLQVLKEYDFIQKDSVTENQTGDVATQDSHGTGTMSLVGGYKEGQIVSPAFHASFILAKTEDVASESKVEEDNWAAAMEWFEREGVDVASSSLGYSEFDDPKQNYTYTNMNGRTAITSRAAVLAARRGVVVCNAMGNEGNYPWHYLTAPADADSIISVGAVNYLGQFALFSSVGPSSDGRIKPEVVAMGVSDYAAVPGKTGYTKGFTGTSSATPLVSGCAVLVLASHPELTPMQVREALCKTANNSSAPDNNVGWGVIDVYKAILYHGMVISTEPDISLTPDSNFSISTYIVSKYIVKKDSVQLYYRVNKTSFFHVPMTLTDTVDASTFSGRYTGTIPQQQPSDEVKFYVGASDATNKFRTSPYNAPLAVYDIKTGLANVVPPAIPASFLLEQNYPNPFNPVTTIRFAIPSAGSVTLKLYDVLGRERGTIVNEHLEAGSYIRYVDGSAYPSGVYFYRLSTGKYSDVKKMTLIK